MSPKNLSAKNKTHKLLLSNLKDNRVFQIYKKFEKHLNINDDFIVAVSGGPDSLALTYLTKIYSIKKLVKVRYIIVDHKLRKESFLEAKSLKKKLKKYSINLDILTWYGKKPKTNIQAIARNERYKLLFNEAEKFKIKNIFFGHHLDDLFENFFIRMLRGSGLNGLVSLDKETRRDKINLIRPLLNINKKDLIYIATKVFGSYAKDPSNNDDKFKRVRIRNFLKQLEKEGLDKNKFHLTIKNLKYSNEAIKFYTNKNLSLNTFFNKKKESFTLKESFFDNSKEVVFRSFTEIIKFVGKKYYPVRGKKVDNIIQSINTKNSFKVTLGGCLILKVNKTVIVSKE